MKGRKFDWLIPSGSLYNDRVMPLMIRRFAQRLTPCLLLTCWLLSPKLARGDDTGAFDWVPPADWPAAARVNSYLGAYLENSILAPLDSPVPPPRRALGAMNIDFAAHTLAAATPTERALYANAANLCDLVARVLDERDLEQGNLINVGASGNAVNPLDRPAYAVSGHYSWNLERERARSQHRQEVQAGLAKIDRGNSFVVFNLKHWSDQVVGFRQSIQQAAINLSAAQIRFDRETAAAAAHPPTLPAAAPAVAGSNPPPTAAPAVAPADTDPVIGDWWTGNGAPLTLRADHGTSGREGSWVYTCTTNSGRNYEMRWAHKDWVDYVVLSEDGKTLAGKSRNKAIAYYRR